MAISHYLKIIARGSQGARSLPRDQACDLFGQILDGGLTDLEVGAFCIAMRVKGETPEELAGYLDALHQRLAPLPASTRPLIVLPSYNGSRKLPVFTPLLALLLAREGLPVLVHGTCTEDTRVTSQAVLQHLGVTPMNSVAQIAAGQVAFAPTALLQPSLARLLDVRRTLGVRNSAHSLVKLMNPLANSANQINDALTGAAPAGRRAVVVGSYTHREYAESMAATFALMGADALLLRGTEGEPVADARRMPQMDGFLAGHATRLQEAQTGTVAAPIASSHDASTGAAPEGAIAFPVGQNAEQTAHMTQALLAGKLPVPASVARQVEQLLHLVRQIESAVPTP